MKLAASSARLLLEIAVENFAEIDSDRFAVAAECARVEAQLLDAHGQLLVGCVCRSCETDSAAFGRSILRDDSVAASVERDSRAGYWWILTIGQLIVVEDGYAKAAKIASAFGLDS